MKSPDNHDCEQISCSTARTLPELFRMRAEISPNTLAYRQYHSKTKVWNNYSWHETAMLAGRWQHALAREGLHPGDRVAVLLRNCIEWVCFDQAALSLGLVVVPLYTSDTPENIAYILADCEAGLLLVEDIRQWQKLAPLQSQFPAIQSVLHLQGDSCLLHEGNPASPALRLVSDWLPDETVSFQASNGDTNSLATIVYTSGTTGRPKGVMLSHRNILWNAAASLLALSVYPDDVFLSFLPLSHMFERTAGYYLPMMAGCSVAYARSIQELGEDMMHIRPTVLIAVPRIFEKIYGKIQNQLRMQGPLARQLFHVTEHIGWQRFEASQGRGKQRILSILLWPILRRLVADRVLARFGGRMRVAVSGGAPLYDQIAHCLIGMGLPLIQGYGLTESSPVISANRLEHNIPESVGKPIRDVTLRIADNHELWVKSPGVMLGYWNRPDDARSAIDKDGWLHTGDQAEIIDDHLYIRGRIKEIIVTSSGEKIPPVDMEMAICQDELFEQAMVTGEGKPYLTAILVLNADAWQAFAAELQLKPDDPASLYSPLALKSALDRVRLATRIFPVHARIRAIHMTLTPWTVKNGLITPTLKLKRNKIALCYATVINQLYAKHTVMN